MRTGLFSSVAVLLLDASLALGQPSYRPYPAQPTYAAPASIGYVQTYPAPPIYTDDSGSVGESAAAPASSGSSNAWATDGEAGQDSITDRMWLQVMCGAVFSPTRGIGPHDVPDFNLALTDVRLGLTLMEPDSERPWFRGAFDGILELTTAPIIKGYGNIVIGPTALFRYDFAELEWPIVPYLQGGAGIAYNDAYRNQTQRAIGQAQEFTLHAGIGLHYPICPSWSLDAEADFLHISNAGLASRNAGINAVGGTLGLTYYFHK